MAGFGLKFRLKDLGADKKLQGMIGRLSRKGKFLQAAGVLLLRSIDLNFQSGGRPKKWKARSEPYAFRMRRARKGKVLVVSGNLTNSVTAQVAGGQLIVGSNLKYARIHQLGGMAGRGRKVEIPARPYLVVQDEDARRLGQMAADIVMTGRQK